MKQLNSCIVKRYSRLLILILILLTGFNLQAQVKLMVTGSIELDDGEKPAGAILTIEKNGTPYKKVSISETGKFAVSVTYQDEFVFSFEKKEYVTKKVAISTKVPNSILDEGYDPISFKVGLFKQYEGMNTVIFNQPVSRYKYDEKTDEFIFDTDYTKTIQSEIAKVEAEVLVKKQVEKEEKIAKQLATNNNANGTNNQNNASTNNNNGGNNTNSNNKTNNGKITPISENDRDKRTAANAMTESEIETNKRAKAKSDEEWKKKLANNKPKDFSTLSDEEKLKRAKAKEEEEKLKKEKEEKAKSLYSAKGKSDEDKRKELQAKGDEDSKKIAEAKAREEEYARLYKEAKAKSEEELRKFLADARMKSYLSKIYPEGITIETTSDKWKSTKRVIVNRNGLCNVFTEIIHSWGGKYYFKNNETISQHVFGKETKPVGSEAIYNKSE